MSLEAKIAAAMIGHVRPSVLMTDAYKLAMAQAGFPLRKECFVLSFRTPGLWYIPFNLAEVMRHLLPDSNVTLYEDQFLRRFDSNGYDLSPAMLKALDGDVDFWCPPVGSVVLQDEPLLTAFGPSFKVSWLEDMAIWLNFPIQIATDAKKGVRAFEATCEDEADIIRLTLEACGINDAVVTRQNPTGLIEADYKRARDLIEALPGSQVFEVGLRAATCMQRHLQVLRACLEADITATSNLWGAFKLGMTPVGTTGHEHQQRWGVDDRNGFRAIRDMRPRSPSYLPDTTDADDVGLPAVFDVVREQPDREFFVRFDERAKIIAQLSRVHAEIDHLPGHYVFEDGIKPESARIIQGVCQAKGIAAKRLHFGSGGFLVHHGGPHGRDAVSAVWKLSETGGRPTMKHAAQPNDAKRSLPGRPVILRSVTGQPPLSLVAQQGEVVSGFAPIQPGFSSLDDLTAFLPEAWLRSASHVSQGTAKLIRECQRQTRSLDLLDRQNPPGGQSQKETSTCPS